jgi:hypothetical protein
LEPGPLLPPASTLASLAHAPQRRPRRAEGRNGIPCPSCPGAEKLLRRATFHSQPCTRRSMPCTSTGLRGRPIVQKKSRHTPFDAKCSDPGRMPSVLAPGRFSNQKLGVGTGGKWKMHHCQELCQCSARLAHPKQKTRKSGGARGSVLPNLQN